MESAFPRRNNICVCNEVTQIPQGTAKVQLVFGSADGHAAYQRIFGTRVRQIFPLSGAIRDCSEINAAVFGELPLQIDDFLLFVKTARTSLEGDIPVYFSPENIFRRDNNQDLRDAFEGWQGDK
jgi:hypothetical protein